MLSQLNIYNCSAASAKYRKEKKREKMQKNKSFLFHLSIPCDRPFKRAHFEILAIPLRTGLFYTFNFFFPRGKI